VVRDNHELVSCINALNLFIFYK